MIQDYLLVTILTLAAALTATAQANYEVADAKSQILVSQIGDDEAGLSRLSLECSDMLLTVQDNSMAKAYESWIQMMADLEQYAQDQGYDIKGIKLWMNVFWNQDGSIRHISYYPKPSSRNTDFTQLGELMNDFALQYNSKLLHTSCFSHYGSVSFPTFIDLMIKGDNK